VSGERTYSRTIDVTRLLDLDEVVTCLPVIQEVLQGFTDEAAFRKAHEAMRSLPIVESPLVGSVFEEAKPIPTSCPRAARRLRRTRCSGRCCGRRGAAG
jgi:hypothetical protein